jgi:hypothetical protein
MTTTDVAGPSGYHPTDYTPDFNGTSAAAPLAAGVVALMLEVNPLLTWRDVQHILVDTATPADAANPGWLTNGSGRLFHPRCGFGRVNAEGAVAAAVNWETVPEEAPALTAAVAEAKAIPDNAAGIAQAAVISGQDSFFTEHVELTVTIEHPRRGDLRISLRSPAGTESVMAERHGDNGNDYSAWKFTTVASWGENPNGEWTLTVSDERTGLEGTLINWSLRVHGFIAPSRPTGAVWH